MRKMASRVEGTVRAAGGRSQTGEKNTRMEKTRQKKRWMLKNDDGGWGSTEHVSWLVVMRLKVI